MPYRQSRRKSRGREKVNCRAGADRGSRLTPAEHRYTMITMRQRECSIVALRHHHRWRQIGLPEFLALVLVASVVVFTALWLLSRGAGEWHETPGSVVSGEIVPVRDRPRPEEIRVRVHYTYTAQGLPYTGFYEGFWPAAGSPNALDEGRIEELTQEGRPVTVYFDPLAPDRSKLFFAELDAGGMYLALAVVAGGLTLLYCMVLYPAWRR